MTPTLAEMMDKLNSMANPTNVAGQQRFGIQGEKMLGISMYDLRALAKGITDHELALQLWQTGVHEARILAGEVDDPKQVTREQMEAWVNDFDSWDVVDQVTDELFIHTAYCLEVLPIWAKREEEFVRRAPFAMMAALVVHRKDIPDETVRGFFPLIEAAASDDRNFVWKAVNWALRNIGKWRPALRAEAVACAKRVLAQNSKTARKIANDALREFEKKFGSDYVAVIQG
jgi:3-methyladenine DNA glycosylase AlkD